jgi:AcrR family transcriptional regulator
VADLRERKKAVLRRTIVRTAVELFTERGFDAVSVDEIAAASMCSRSTFNRYFGTKEDVLFPGAGEITIGLSAALKLADADAGPWLQARACLAEQLTTFVSNIDADLRERCFLLWTQESAPRRRYLEFAFEWERILVDYFVGRAGEGVDARIRCRLAASAMVAALRTALHGTIEFGQDPGAVIDQAFAMLEAGLDADALRAAPTRTRRASGRQLADE